MGFTGGHGRRTTHGGGPQLRPQRHAHGGKALRAFGAKLRRRCDPRSGTQIRHQARPQSGFTRRKIVKFANGGWDCDRHGWPYYPNLNLSAAPVAYKDPASALAYGAASAVPRSSKAVACAAFLPVITVHRASIDSLAAFAAGLSVAIFVNPRRVIRYVAALSTYTDGGKGSRHEALVTYSFSPLISLTTIPDLSRSPPSGFTRSVLCSRTRL